MAAPTLTGGRVGIIHVHSAYSHDGLDSLESLRDFALARGIAWVGLTDHAEDLDPARFDEMVSECEALSDQRVRLIPGLEYRFAGHTGLHLLALGLSRWIEPATPEAFVREARGAARFTIVAHPVLARYRIPAAVLDGIDAIEVWNAAYNTRFLPDPRAIRILHALRARRPEVVGTAGLDQHDARNDRETRVIVAEGEQDPLAALRAGRFVNVGRTMRFDPGVALPPSGLEALTAARWLLDRAERVQHHVMYPIKKWRARR
ncbi:MAG TPA: PHP domain-containing protein [Gemmatimonadaceae bacterium]|nr:PHP domain-containing protein [Gemmatimonadaceae bacterium]